MLLGQNRGGYQIYHLLSLLYRFKRGTDCNLRLSIAHIPADQTVHDLSALHIPFGGFDGGKLSFRLLKGEHLLKFPLPHRILSVLKPVFLLPCGIKLHQIPGHLPGGLAHFRLGAGPLLGSELAQFGPFGVGRGIFLNDVQPCGQHIQASPVPVFNFHVILDYFVNFNLFNALVNTQPMVFMNYVVSYLQFIKIIDLASLMMLLFFLLLTVCAKNVALRYHGKFKQRVLETFQNPAIKGHDFPRLQLSVGILRIKSRQLLLPQIPGQPLRPGPGAGEQKDPVSVSLIAF